METNAIAFVSLRPSFAQFVGALKARRGRALALVGSLVPAVISSAAAVYFWSHGNIGLVLAAVGVAAIFVASLLGRALLYITRVRIDVSHGGVTRRGFPFRKYSTASVAAVEQTTIEFAYGITSTAWILVDARRRGHGWLVSDYWTQDQIYQLSTALGVRILSAPQVSLTLQDLATTYGDLCRRW